MTAFHSSFKKVLLRRSCQFILALVLAIFIKKELSISVAVKHKKLISEKYSATSLLNLLLLCVSLFIILNIIKLKDELENAFRVVIFIWLPGIVVFWC